jgi:hypothetical protein
MEAGGIPLRQWIEQRFDDYNTRIKSNHDSVVELRKKQGTQGESLIRIEEQLDDQGHDIEEMKNDLKWIKRGIFGAIAVGLMFTIAVANLVVQVAH